MLADNKHSHQKSHVHTIQNGGIIYGYLVCCYLKYDKTHAFYARVLR